MKKILSTVLAAAMTISAAAPFATIAAGTVYEFEKGTLADSGGTSVIAMAGASGGKVVDLRDSGDSVTITVNAANAGNHKLTVHYNQPYDESGKYQTLLVNGQEIRQLFCDYTGENQFKDVTLSAYLKEGNNTVTIEASWGWTLLDYLTIEESSSTAGMVQSKLSNPNASAEAASLYSFLCDTYGSKILSGQQESTWMGSEDYEMLIIQNASGRMPAIRGLDYMGDDFAGCNRRAKAWYAKGGIVTICWHCGSDFSGSHTESMETKLY